MQTLLKDVLSLERIDQDSFRAHHHKENFKSTLFGGQVLAQALMAGGLTVPSAPPHSLHAYFLRPGSSEHPVDYHVVRNRDGRSFSHRTVNAVQAGKTLFSAMISFHQPEPNGYSHAVPWSQRPEPPDVSALMVPGELAPSQPELSADSFEFFGLTEGMFSNTAAPPGARFWLRGREAFSDDALLQRCALAYASDFGLLGTALVQHSTSLFKGEIIGASVDHAIWFHSADFSINDWLLYEIDSPWAGGARGLSQGKLFNQQGLLVASTSQEGLIRPKTQVS
ncbi:MAG TPA: acyl-CoA thioesterase domain-containing protein [Marinagarivorans sp.]